MPLNKITSSNLTKFELFYENKEARVQCFRCKSIRQFSQTVGE